MSPVEATSRARLLDQLKKLGIGPGDAVMLHASLRRIGAVEGGVAGLIAAFREVVGDGGTLLMILGAVNTVWDEAREAPPPERPAILARAPPFDALTTPANTDVGHLAEAFRLTRGVLVTDHPDCRFAAIGAKARWLLEGSTWDDYMGPDSPLDRLCRIGGKVLRMGANDDTTTVLHWAEYVVSLRSKDAYTLHFRVATHTPSQLRSRARRVVALRGGPDFSGPEGGAVVVASRCLNNETGIVDWPGEDYFATILKAYRASGRGRYGRIGNAASEVFDAADIVSFGAEWMQRTFGPGDAQRITSPEDLG
jgi:aminoglycoside 3-N-acetyltransferase